MDFLRDPTLRELKGLFYACFYDPRIQQEKRVSLKTKTRSVAQRRLKEVKDAFERGRFNPYTDSFQEATPLEEAIRRWLRSKSGIRDSTRQGYRSVLDKFRRFLEEPLFVRQVRTEDCEPYIQDPNLAPASRLERFKCLRQFFDWTVEENYRTENPCAEITRPRTSGTKTPQFLTRAEVDKITTLIREEEGPPRYGEDPWLVHVIEVAVLTGLRVSEIAHQRWRDTDLESGFFRVRSYEDEERSFKTKSGRERMVPLIPRLVDRLRRLRADQKEAGTYGPKLPVLRGRYGDPVRPKTISKHFTRYRKKALPERSEISFHNLRHTAASWMVQHGMDLYYVKEILGHSSIKTTQKYAHLAEESLKGAHEEVMSRIDRT